MSEENNNEDSLQPSWAAHELFALGLTLVLAVWVVSNYGKESRPVSLTTERDEARAAKRAELAAADSLNARSGGTSISNAFPTSVAIP